MLDLALFGGVLIDGTGAPARPADVGVVATSPATRTESSGDVAAKRAACMLGRPLANMDKIRYAKGC